MVDSERLIIVYSGVESRSSQDEKTVRNEVDVKSKVIFVIFRILMKKSVESVMNELQLLKCLKH